eukprot:5006010-Karenia_brevis.AAC.1
MAAASAILFVAWPSRWQRCISRPASSKAPLDQKPHHIQAPVAASPGFPRLAPSKEARIPQDVPAARLASASPNFSNSTKEMLWKSPMSRA